MTASPEFLPPPSPVDAVHAVALECELFVDQEHPTLNADDVLPILRRTTNRASAESDNERPSTFKNVNPEDKLLSKLFSMIYLSTHCCSIRLCVLPLYAY